MTLFQRRKSKRRVDRRGFTLIEVLIVVVILGILASIIVKMFDSKKHAYLAAMKSDLRNLVTAEESFYYSNSRYTGMMGVGMGMGMGMGPAQLDFTLSAGVALELNGNGAGFSGRTTHSQIPDQCAIFWGSPTTVFAPATVEGMLVCDGGGMGMVP